MHIWSHCNISEISIHPTISSALTYCQPDSTCTHFGDFGVSYELALKLWVAESTSRLVSHPRQNHSLFIS